jgi:hypothetical protein
MSRKAFEIPLNEDAFIGVELELFRGHLLSFVVRLMYHSQDGYRCLARYDTAHGRPHRDLVSHNGRLLQKDWLLGTTFPNAANHAISDFKENYEAYIQQFKARHHSSS